jgi:hypothetical protein
MASASSTRWLWLPRTPQEPGLGVSGRDLSDTLFCGETATSTWAVRAQIVQPGLAGSHGPPVSTLAPLFAAALLGTAGPFYVGLAAAIGAGISVGFAETLSDNGSLTDRHPDRHRARK